ncbi:MAG: cytochrome C [Planctomycetaceae bacterium]|nr:MAG: cytochrome C [Planctomycetaceae bacterium]
MTSRSLAYLIFALGTFGSPLISAAQDDDFGRVVRFSRDIAPIFAARCLECHDADNMKGGFQIDDADTVSGYLEAGDAEASTLFTEYLLTDDEDMLMPPSSHGGPLSPSELALIKVWINEGADWPEDAVVGTTVEVSIEEGVSPGDKAVAPPRTLLGRVWAFQGYLHPATVHFPIALLLVGGLFVVVSWVHPTLGNHVALTCLYIGAASSVAASAMGWSFATQQGYGGWAKVDFDSTIFWHRWSGLVVTVIAVVTALVAVRATGSHSRRLNATWKFGLLVCAALVGLVGHQGGDLTYGESHYPRAFQILLDSPGPGGVESGEADPVGTESDTQAVTETGASVPPVAAPDETPAVTDEVPSESEPSLQPSEPSAEPVAADGAEDPA